MNFISGLAIGWTLGLLCAAFVAGAAFLAGRADDQMFNGDRVTTPRND